MYVILWIKQVKSPIMQGEKVDATLVQHICTFGAL